MCSDGYIAQVTKIMKVAKSDILKLLLMGIGVAGILLIAVTAPGLFTALGPFNKGRHFRQPQLKRSFDHARVSGLITVKPTSNGHLVMLTHKGQEKLNRFRLGELKLNRPKKWDGKWRIVVFDIPEKFKLNRLTFSQKLKELGFIQMQKSVWVWPYEIQEEVDLMKEAY